MPTVLRIGGLRVVIYPNDHRPPHVHVLGAGAEAVFNLIGTEDGVILRTSQGFSTAQLNRIAEALKTARAQLLAQWERIHDHYRP